MSHAEPFQTPDPVLPLETVPEAHLPPQTRGTESLASKGSGLQLAIVGAGPAGLALALHASRRLPQARITVYDRWPAQHDLRSDRRTLALSLGSVQFLQRLGLWEAVGPLTAPILRVHVSQVQPDLAALCGLGSGAEVTIDHTDVSVPQLGAVVPYGTLVAPMREAWLARCAADPERCQARLGEAVQRIEAVPGGARVTLASAPECPQVHDLAVVAEGGVFAEQARKAVVHDYRQTAWVGTVELEGGAHGLAIERFTNQGPLALLPLPDASEGARNRAALVWCVPTDDDPVRSLETPQRLAVLQHWLPAVAGRPVALSPLKDFALGLNAERTLVQGRTVRIGNAAQTLHPVAGQGLNLGLRDVFALVERLERSRDLTAALSGVEWARAPDRWSLITATDFLARSFTWKLPGLSTLTGMGLSCVQHLPGVRQALARHLMFGRR